MQTLLKIDHLEKSYKDKKVLHGISFQINKGEILGLLGPNGAGKSTTIRILTGALGYDKGEISAYGTDIHQNIRAYKKKLGIVPQDLALYEDLSARQNVSFFASLYGLKGKLLQKRCEWALDFTGLKDKAGDKVNTFSGGMKRRLNIACAIAHKPELLIMDEPTAGIDPQSRNHILNSIKKLSEEGMTILYTTHYMEEVEEIASRIIIIDHGDIITEGTKEELKEDIEKVKHFHINAELPLTFDKSLLYQIEGVREVIKKEGELEINVLKGVENLDRIISCMLEQGAKLNNIALSSASLETVFLKLTGRSLRD